MNNPLVSILIPTYNSSEFLKETLNCAIHQTYKNIEIIVSDDCSIDDSTSIVKDFMVNDGRIKLLMNSNNLGMCENWNKLFKEAKGDYLLKLDADDILHSKTIETAIQILKSNKKIDAVAFKYQLLEEQKLIDLKVHTEFESGIQKDLLKTIFLKNPFHLCFTVLKKQSLLKLETNGKLFLETEIGDLDLLLRFAENDMALYFINKVSGYYRMHQTNSSKTPLKQAKSWIKDVFPAHQGYLKEHLYKETKKVLYQRIVHYLKNCIYHRQKIDFDYLKVSLLTFVKF